MKAIITFLGLAVIAILSGCQNDIDIDTSDNNSNNSESVFTAKVKRTSMFNGAIDDVLDNAPCFAVQFPINITLNNRATTITSITELNNITPTDLITINFPITVTNYDYSEIVVNSQTAYDNLKSNCNDLIAQENTPLNCIDFNYPIQIFTSTGNQQQNIFDFNTDQELYVFIDNLDNDTLYSFNYPIEITENNTSSLTVENDSFLTGYLDSCN